jgi:drug/metabolite transporter superfamily protein YnfA
VNRVRSVGIFFVNLLVALVGPGEAVHALRSYFALFRSEWAKMAFESGVRSLAAFALGCSIYWLWRRREMKWVWVPGVIWLIAGILRQLSRSNSALDTLEVYGGITRRDIETITTWSGFIVPFLQTFFYAVGALYSSIVAERLLVWRAKAPSPSGKHYAAWL